MGQGTIERTRQLLKNNISWYLPILGTSYYWAGGGGGSSFSTTGGPGGNGGGGGGAVGSTGTGGPGFNARGRLLWNERVHLLPGQCGWR
jgi:hypothetical protein